MRAGYVSRSSVSPVEEAKRQLLEFDPEMSIHSDPAVKYPRAELTRLVEILRPGDELWVVDLATLARSTVQLLQILTAVKRRSAEVHSLHVMEDWITEDVSPTVFMGLIAFERSIVDTRTREGRKISREAGGRFGRPTALTEEEIRHSQMMYEHGQSASEIAKAFNVHKTTIYRALRGHR
jgi:DNA invertase Pin-like site-specific DNA recombinase